MTKANHVDEFTLRRIIDLLDKNHDGHVTKDEYWPHYKKVHPTKNRDEFDTHWAEMDKNGDGQLSFEELATYYGYDIKKSTNNVQDMSDEQILETLRLQTVLAEVAAAESPTDLSASFHRSKKHGSKSPTIVSKPKSSLIEETDRELLFIQACDLGDSADVEQLLVEGVDVRIEDERGEMPLHKLARHGDIKHIRAVLEVSHSKVHDLNWSDKKGRTPLSYACEYGMTDCVAMLLNSGAAYEVSDINEMSPLHYAATANTPALITTFLSHPNVNLKAILDKPDKTMRTPLHIAAFQKNEEVVKAFIDFGADVHKKDRYGHIPSMLASKKHRRSSVNVLNAAELAKSLNTTEIA